MKFNFNKATVGWFWVFHDVVGTLNTVGFPPKVAARHILDVILFANLNKLPDKQLTCRWVEMLWYLCYVMVIVSECVQGSHGSHHHDCVIPISPIHLAECCVQWGMSPWCPDIDEVSPQIWSCLEWKNILDRVERIGDIFSQAVTLLPVCKNALVHPLEVETYEFNSSPLNKMDAISQTVFSDAFPWMKSFIFLLKFHWSLFIRVRLTIT